METSQSWIANVEILNELLRKESWHNTFFAKFAGFVDISQDDNGQPTYSPSGKPIEILTDFVSEGRDNMLIPFLRDLTGSPVYGDTVLKGTGEDQSMYWLRSYVNQYRKAVMKRSGQMSEQRQKMFKLYDAARPQLSKWFSKWENQSIFGTFYEGVSPNLSLGTSDDGLGLNKRYHPNWYILDGDVVTAIGTEKYTCTNAQLDSAIGTGGSCDSDMNADALLDLRVKCMELMIPQIESSQGHKFWVMLLHPEQMASLQKDDDYKNAQQRAFMGKMLDLPELSGAQGYYAGFVLFEDIVGVREWDATDVGVDGITGSFFGDSTSDRLSPSAVGTSMWNAIVFGNSCVGKGVADDLHFTDEIDDHENTIEVGGAVINGYNRADFVAEGVADESSNVFKKNQASAAEYAAVTAATNQSSLIFCTDEG